MNARVSPSRFTQDQFNEIYRLDVIEALEHDPELDFKNLRSAKYLQEGVCPGCGERSLYISREKPFQLACNRLNECRFTERTRERYSYLFENLSERFPATPQNPNATADAYLQRNRGFDISRMVGWYTQARRYLENESYGDSVRFPLCDGYWERLIDAKAVTANGGKKAGIKKGMKYVGNGWVPPGQTFELNDRVYVVEGIFHATALSLAGYKAIASISANNFPWEIIEANTGKLITWVVALDNDKAGRGFIDKYLAGIRKRGELSMVALGDPDRDWDDVYRDGQLDDAYLDEALYQGRLFTARSAIDKAYVMHTKRPRPFYLLEFGSCLYAIKVNAGDLDAARDGEERGGYKDHFKKHASVDQVANCVPRFEYIERDALTSEQRYFFSFEFPSAHNNCRQPLAPVAISDPSSFSKALLERTPGGLFEGGSRVLSMLRAEWMTNPITVRTLPFIGYDESSAAYCYPTFGYYKGNEIMANEHGYLNVDGKGLKTSTRSYPIVHSSTFDPDWFDDFLAVFALNGLAALAWWTGSLFAQQIRESQGQWTFLELTGIAGAGKSLLLRYLQKLYGRRNEEGIKPSGNGASAIGLLRAMGAVSNLPVVLLESDKTIIDSQGREVVIQYNWEDIKPLTDHQAKLRVTGVKSTNADTDALIFRGSICISQNAKVEGEESILSRIVYLHMTREHHTREAKPKAQRLQSMAVEDLAGYLGTVLCDEQGWLKRFDEAFTDYEARLQNLPGLAHPRVIHFHAQVMAAGKATQAFFPGWTDDLQNQLVKHLESCALEREQTIGAESHSAAQFWQLYHYLNEDVVTDTNAEGTTEQIRERLNHSADRDLIAINIEHFQQACRRAGLDVLPTATLRRVLPNSTTHRFQEIRKVRSCIEKRPLNCWVFAVNRAE